MENPRPSRRTRLRLLLGLGLAAVLATLCWQALLWGSRRASDRLLRTASITVTELDGRPAPGIQVLVEWWQPGAQWTRFQGATDAEGHVNLQELRGEWATLARFDVHVLLPGCPTGPFALTEDTRIVVPPRAPLRLQLCTADGSPWRPRAAEDAWLQIQWQDGWGHTGAEPDANGLVDFGNVVQDLDLQLDFHVHAWSGQRVVRAPSDAAGRAPIPLVIAAGLPHLVGRMLDADGRPLQERFGFDLQGTTEHGSARMSAWSFTTDAEGGVEFFGDRLPAAGTLTLYRHDGQRQRIALQPGAGPEEILVGDVRWPGR